MTAETETANPEPAIPTSNRPPLVQGTTVAPIIPQDVEQVFRLATIIIRAKMAPKALATAEAVMVAMIHGMEVGLTPMAAVQSICVINGMPTLYGDGLIGVVRASGLLVDFEETFARDEDGQVTAATCRAVRRGQETPIVRVFTRAQAVKARLASKPGPWSDYPERMLQMRARSWALRDGFADVLRGLKTIEEAEDIRDLQPGPDGVYSEAPPRPQRADFEGEAEPETEEEPGVAENAPAVDELGAAWVFMDEEGEDQGFETAGDAGMAFRAMVKRLPPAQLEAVWADNESFRTKLKAADPAAYTAAQAAYDRRVEPSPADPLDVPPLLRRDEPAPESKAAE